MVCNFVVVLKGKMLEIHTKNGIWNLVCIWGKFFLTKRCKYIPNCKITKWYVIFVEVLKGKLLEIHTKMKMDNLVCI